MDWIQILAPTLFGTGLFILGGIITWIIRSKIEESRAIRVKLNEERRKTYSEILGPYIRIFTDFKGKGPTQAIEEIKSYDYRKTAFDLALFGSDNVVRAYNAFLQYGYKGEANENMEQRVETYMRLWGKLLLEIRKDVGNKKTCLNEFDMLRWLITDIDKLEHMKE